MLFNIVFIAAFMAGSLAAAIPEPSLAGEQGIDFSKFQFQAAGTNDLRGPCPGLNTLANHGFLPRDGRGLTVSQILKASLDGYNVEGDVVLLPAKIGMTTTSAVDTFTLEDIKFHDSIEHDASVSRADFFTGDNFHFNSTIYKTMEESNPGKDAYDPASVGEVQRLRLIHSETTNPTTKNTLKEFVIRTRESSLFLAVMGNATTGVAPKKFVDIFFKEERLPIAEGWTRSPTGINGDSLGPIESGIIAASQWAPNTTQEATISLVLMGDDILVI